jgi:type I restriction enzyme S subunit
LYFGDGDWIESKDQSDYGIRLIQTGNVGNGEYKDKGDKARYISEETFERLSCTEVYPGDILISRLPDPIGRACIVPDLPKSITAVDCTIVRLKDILLPEFFVIFTKTPAYTVQIDSFTTGSTRKRVSRANLGSIRVPVPDIHAQKRFVSISKQSDKSKLKLQNSLAGLSAIKYTYKTNDRRRSYYGNF